MTPDKQQPILTVPEQVSSREPYLLTGNEYISLPFITLQGGITSINAISMQHRGLFQFEGNSEHPLIMPLITCNNSKIKIKNNCHWTYELDWLPAFNVKHQNLTVNGKIIAPPGYKGFFYLLSFTNNSEDELKINYKWQGSWFDFSYCVFNCRKIDVRRSISFDQWTNSLVLEAQAGLPLAALAMATNSHSEWRYDNETGKFEIADELIINANDCSEAVLYVALNLEADGASTTIIDLKRHGHKSLTRSSMDWLETKREKISGEKKLSSLLNRNLFFCYYFSLGRALDSDDLVPVTSRSSRYYVSGAFWSRDTLLWSFPAIMSIDKSIARELLLAVFKRHVNHAGEHAHYINGTVLYGGFELDQLSSYFLALKHYLKLSKDYSIVKEECIALGLQVLIEKAKSHYDHHTGLYSTFLDPSDDPVTYPYLTYNNALLKCSFSFLASIKEKLFTCTGYDLGDMASRLEEAIYKHCIADGPLGPMFVWSVDGKGNYDIYDNPPGSLQLLPHYGFCSRNDHVFRNTALWIRSSHNSFFHKSSKFEESGSKHAHNPWPLAACNDLLALNINGTGFFKNITMDSGLFCETVDPETGVVCTGAAFASGAGFLSYALKNMTQRGVSIE